MTLKETSKVSHSIFELETIFEHPVTNQEVFCIANPTFLSPKPTPDTYKVRNVANSKGQMPN